MLENDIRKLVVNDKIPAVNLYLYMNAYTLEIEKKYYPMLNIIADRDITDNIEHYISETEYDRYFILDLIVNQINALTQPKKKEN
jgi:hypothetical protein